MKLTWPHVAIVIAVLATIVALAMMNKDTSAILSLATLLFVGIGLIVGQQQAQREQTNGTTTKMLEMMDNMAKRLADTMPLNVDDVTATVTHRNGKERDVNAV